MITLKFEFSVVIIKDFVLKKNANFSLKPKPKVVFNKANFVVVV